MIGFFFACLYLFLSTFDSSRTMNIRFAWLILLLWSGLAGAESAPAEHSSDSFVTAPDSLLHRLELEPVKRTSVAETLRLPGRVALDEHRVARIGPGVSGRVTDIRAYIGESVRKGDVLAQINSTELSKAQEDYLKSRTQVNLQRLTVQRASRLLEAGIISEAIFRERESALEEREVELRAGADQLRVLGMSDRALARLDADGQIHSEAPVIATVTGTVIERHISVGQTTQPSDNLYTVADLSRVWVVAEVPEQQTQLVVPEGLAEVRIPALGDIPISGRVIYVADVVNPVTRTVTVRMALENSGRRIKPEMLATMVISRPSEHSLVLPARAIIRQNDQDFIFVQTAPKRFELKPVRLGASLGEYRKVLEGVTEGEIIVAGGAFHLNNERIRLELE